MKKHIFLLHCFLLTGAWIFAQNEVPLDPSVRTGVLKNGMTYYIKHNEEPKERVSFYFVQKVGSVLEKESQRGLAHFLEHMAFNGLEHFKGKKMLKYLEKNGISFGNEINASTGFDETVYNIDNVPVSNPKLLDSVLLVLHDWSGYISLEDKEIDSERGVINEEWRTRNTPFFRSYIKVYTQGYLAGSTYAERAPMGLMSVVNNFKYKELKDYYKLWYRPDLQAIVLVGDVNVDEMEKKIKTIFSAIPLNKNLPKRPEFNDYIPNKLVFVKSVDKELGEPQLEFSIRKKAIKRTGKDHINHQLVASVATSILNKRFREFTVMPDCPALSIRLSSGNVVNPIDITHFNINPKKEKMLESFDLALTEFYRYMRFGATPSELEREKISIKNSNISYLKNKQKISNSSYVGDFISHFLDNSPYMDVEWEIDYKNKQLDAITHQDVLDYIASIYNEEDQMVAVIGTDSIAYPSKEEFKTALEKAKGKELTPYVEKVDERPLVSEKLEAKPIKGTFEVKSIKEAKGYILSNGAKIIIYHTDYDKDRIYMRAYSEGGLSLLDESLLPSANLATGVAENSGLGVFTKNELSKKLAGTSTSLSLDLSALSESSSGFSTKTDIEVLFQRIYLQFMEPRFDEDIFKINMENLYKALTSKEKNKKSAFSDSIQMAYNNHNKRWILFNEKNLKKIDFDKVKQVYKDRFNNVADFKFVFVGDIDEQQLLQLAQKYIGSISSSEVREKYIDHNLDPAPSGKGKTKVHLIEEMETPQTSVNITMRSKLKYSFKNDVSMHIIGDLLQKKYTETIREEEGGSYAVGANGHMSKEPKELAIISIGFDCNPDKTDKLVSIVYREVDKLVQEIDVDDLKEVKESLIKSRKEQLNKNSYWLSAICSDAFNGVKYVPIDQYVALVSAIGAKDIQKLAKTISNKREIIEGILSPKVPPKETK